MIDNSSPELILGELKGQMREVIHQLGNLSQKFDSLAREVAQGMHLPGKIEELQGDLHEIEERLVALETRKNHADGAYGLIGWFFSSPLAGWVAAAGAIIWSKWGK